MTFRLTCPVCGKRDVHEFTFGGQDRGPRPPQEELGAEEHFRWVQFRLIPGPAGGRTPPQRTPPQRDWWHHGQGCGLWFRTMWDPTTNREVGAEDGDA